MSLIRPGKYLSKFSTNKIQSLFKFGKKHIQRFNEIRIFKGFESIKNNVMTNSIYNKRSLYTGNEKLNLIAYLNYSRLRTNTKLLGYFNKLEDNTLTLQYLDQENKQVGGTVRVDTKELNFSQLSTLSYAQHGYFTEDKIVFAKFDREHNYEIVGNELHYRLEANPNLVGKLNDEITKTEVSSELLYKPHSSLTEKFFYNLSYSN